MMNTKYLASDVVLRLEWMLETKHIPVILAFKVSLDALKSLYATRLRSNMGIGRGAEVVGGPLYS